MRVTEKHILFYLMQDMFSQWYPSPFMQNGLAFSCAESYMMYKKAELFGDTDMMALMRELEDSIRDNTNGYLDLVPQESQNTGATLEDFLKEDRHPNLDWAVWEKCPQAFKRMGRKVQNFKPEVWETADFRTVVSANFAKFTQNSALYAALKRTSQASGFTLYTLGFAEASDRDLVWGCGLLEDDPLIAQRDKWPGRNRLGQAILSVRKQLFSH